MQITTIACAAMLQIFHFVVLVDEELIGIDNHDSNDTEFVESLNRINFFCLLFFSYLSFIFLGKKRQKKVTRQRKIFLRLTCNTFHFR